MKACQHTKLVRTDICQYSEEYENQGFLPYCEYELYYIYKCEKCGLEMAVKIS